MKVISVVEHKGTRIEVIDREDGRSPYQLRQGGRFLPQSCYYVANLEAVAESLLRKMQVIIDLTSEDGQLRVKITYYAKDDREPYRLIQSGPNAGPVEAFQTLGEAMKAATGALAPGVFSTT